MGSQKALNDMAAEELKATRSPIKTTAQPYLANVDERRAPQTSYGDTELDRQAQQSTVIRQNAPKWDKEVDQWERDAIDNGVYPPVDREMYGKDDKHTYQVDEFKRRGVASGTWGQNKKTGQFINL